MQLCTPQLPWRPIAAPRALADACMHACRPPSQAITKGAAEEAEWNKTCEEYKAKYPKVRGLLGGELGLAWQSHGGRVTWTDNGMHVIGPWMQPNVPMQLPDCACLYVLDLAAFHAVAPRARDNGSLAPAP